ncbi:hypothetical protein ACNQ0Y_25880, partial [Enterobacter cloacae complex sp.6730552]|uniref:hypothetical protein n=1 Tax=Enterobacter cloacae complex sp.6730552 TaxID=3397170 RepID=UPI003AAA2041
VWRIFMTYPTIFSLALFKLILLIYITSVWCKIIRSALVGCLYLGAQSAFRAFFVRNPSASVSYGRAEGLSLIHI